MTIYFHYCYVKVLINVKVDCRMLLRLIQRGQRNFCTASQRDINQIVADPVEKSYGCLKIRGQSYETDEATNVFRHLRKLTDRRLHQQKYNPINLLCLRIKDYFHTHYRNRFSSPLYSYVDSLHPVVTLHQNFDSLLVPHDHISRQFKETYYVNKGHVLRYAHEGHV